MYNTHSLDSLYLEYKMLGITCEISMHPKNRNSFLSASNENIQGQIRIRLTCNFLFEKIILRKIQIKDTNKRLLRQKLHWKSMTFFADKSSFGCFLSIRLTLIAILMPFQITFGCKGFVTFFTNGDSFYNGTLGL